MQLKKKKKSNFSWLYCVFFSWFNYKLSFSEESLLTKPLFTLCGTILGKMKSVRFEKYKQYQRTTCRTLMS